MAHTHYMHPFHIDYPYTTLFLAHTDYGHRYFYVASFVYETVLAHAK